LFDDHGAPLDVQLRKFLRRWYLGMAPKLGSFVDEGHIEEAIETCAPLYGDDDETWNMTTELAWQVYGELQAESARWPAVSGVDRLYRAFEDIASFGILVRHDFSCCSTCGHHEMLDLLREELRRRPVRGYAFYDLQSMEEMIEHGNGHVYYYAVERTTEMVEEVGSLVFAALLANGLAPEWPGNLPYIVRVGKVDWRPRIQPMSPVPVRSLQGQWRSVPSDVPNRHTRRVGGS